MQLCEFHPNRVAVGRCHKCGRRFCVECAEETGQTKLCKNCMPETIRREGEVVQAVNAAVPQAPPKPAEMVPQDVPTVTAEVERPAQSQSVRTEMPLPPLPPSTYQPAPVPGERDRKEKKKKKEKKPSWKEKALKTERKAEAASPAGLESTEAPSGAGMTQDESEDFFALVPELPDLSLEETVSETVEAPPEQAAVSVQLSPEMPTASAGPEEAEIRPAPAAEEMLEPPAPPAPAPEPPTSPAPEPEPVVAAPEPVTASTEPPASPAPPADEYDEFDPESFFAEITLPPSTRTVPPPVEETVAAPPPTPPTPPSPAPEPPTAPEPEVTAPPEKAPAVGEVAAESPEPLVEQPETQREGTVAAPVITTGIDEGEQLDAFFAKEETVREAPPEKMEQAAAEEPVAPERPPQAEPAPVRAEPREVAGGPATPIPAEKATTAVERPAVKEKKAPPSEEAATAAVKEEDFLALAPDYDFSELEQDDQKPPVFPRAEGRKGERKSIFAKRRKKEPAEAGIEDETAAAPAPVPTPATAPAPEPGPVAKQVTPPRPKPAKKEKPPTRTPPPAAEAPAPDSMDIDDVLATLVDTTAIAPAPRPKGAFTALEEEGEMPVPKKTGKERREELKQRKDELKEQKRDEKEQNRAERAERWDFLSQPRMNEETVLATTRFRTIVVFVFAWLMTALLWSIPNAFFPFWPWAGDKESLLWALAVGACTGLFFWWKAGRKHSTRLAVQAFLVTIFGIMGGEFFHWSFIILKEKAFRTVFFDLISFKFIWEYGGEILADMARAMFPAMFLVLLLLPAVVAFIIGYGMPPIPEIVFEFGRALRGKGGQQRANTGHSATG